MFVKTKTAVRGSRKRSQVHNYSSKINNIRYYTYWIQIYDVKKRAFTYELIELLEKRLIPSYRPISTKCQLVFYGLLMNGTFKIGFQYFFFCCWWCIELQHALPFVCIDISGHILVIFINYVTWEFLMKINSVCS